MNLSNLSCIASALLLCLCASPSSSLLSPVAPLPNKLQAATRRTTACSTPRTRLLATIADNRGGDNLDDTNNTNKSRVASSKLPPSLLPITLGVFSQMLGEGISLSSLPLHLTRLGATPTSVGLAISCFSLAQMTVCPILVKLSSDIRIGRSTVLRICLAGAASSSLLIAASNSIRGIIAGRMLAGVFAACVPVAQSEVTDILPKEQVAWGLSRVSAASQLGVVVGPAVSAIFQEGFARMGVAEEKCLPAVFCAASVFTLGVLVLMTVMDRQQSSLKDEFMEDYRAQQMIRGNTQQSNEFQNKGQQSTEKQLNEIKTINPPPAPSTSTFRYAQPILRTITIIMGWTAILSNSIYGLFAPKFLHFTQSSLSATYSFAAALMVATQFAFPRLVAAFGEYRVCTMGILAAGMGIGSQSLVRHQPFHSMLYMMNRAGAAVADTSTAALVASSSENREARSRNLALLTSTRAAARIVTPILSSKLFELSCRGGGGSMIASGALPFVTAACFALAVAPLPMLLKRVEEREQ